MFWSLAEWRKVGVLPLYQSDRYRGQVLQYDTLATCLGEGDRLAFLIFLTGFLFQPVFLQHRFKQVDTRESVDGSWAFLATLAKQLSLDLPKATLSH